MSFLLPTGDFLGEFALLTAEPRSANAVARTFSLLQVLVNHDFDRIMAAWPEYSEAMEAACHARLASAATVADRERRQSQHKVWHRRGSKDFSSPYAGALGSTAAADIRSIHHCLRAAAEWKAKLRTPSIPHNSVSNANGCIPEQEIISVASVGSNTLIDDLQLPSGFKAEPGPAADLRSHVLAAKSDFHPFGASLTKKLPAQHADSAISGVGPVGGDCITRGLVIELHGSMHDRLDRLEALSRHRNVAHEGSQSVRTQESGVEPRTRSGQKDLAASTSPGSHRQSAGRLSEYDFLIGACSEVVEDMEDTDAEGGGSSAFGGNDQISILP